jgi:hypothetical protein
MINKIFQFIEGHLKMFGDKFNLLPEHQKEQFLFRVSLCKDDCFKSRKCIYCGCSVPGKLYVSESCNGGERFPDMMNPEEWEKYKKDKKIKIEIINE